ncbi:hypothetical protein FZEAL_10710 [Fusarium zealandicum]|uniref:Aminoglycoside phosphotransferase domain-containing protein n=1 Tax=Fusarium zealandicum TaxID=1053134 RepID=A0A8H4TXX3_9HYPO|nr:hypothetical protein FZEAL_10710 [Fusarium zealandicum]
MPLLGPTISELPGPAHEVRPAAQASETLLSYGEQRKKTESINAGRLARALTLTTLWIRTNQYLRRLWKPQVGLLSILGCRIKVTPYVNLAEAHAMQFIAQHTSVPVPKVHCAFIRNGRTCIVMSEVDG